MKMESGKLHAQFTDRTPPMIADEPIPLNQWHHVGSSYNHKTGKASLWLNGQEVAQQNIGDGVSLDTKDEVILGAKGGDGPYFHGRITAMEIYNVALTQRQINAIGKACQSTFNF